MNKKTAKLLLVFLILMLFSSSPAFADTNVKRISGNDRYQTSTEVSKIYFKNSNKNDVVIAPGDNFKYALYGSQLASALDIPYFINTKHGIKTDVLNELKKLKIKRAFIIGDYNLLDKSVDNTLKANGISVKRLYSNINKDESIDSLVDYTIFNKFHFGEIKGDIAMGIFINDNKFPDLLSVIPLSSELARNQKKVLMSSDSFNYPKKQNQDRQKFVIGGGLIIGGYDSIPSYVTTFENEEIGLYNHSYIDEKTGKLYPDFTGRIAGEDRYSTAVEIAKAYKPLLNKSIKTAVIVNGEDYPDALASGIAATHTDGAILLTEPDKLNEFTKQFIINNDIKDIVIIGGENSVSKDVENELRNLNSKIGCIIFSVDGNKFLVVGNMDFILSTHFFQRKLKTCQKPCMIKSPQHKQRQLLNIFYIIL